MMNEPIKKLVPKKHGDRNRNRSQHLLTVSSTVDFQGSFAYLKGCFSLKKPWKIPCTISNTRRWIKSQEPSPKKISKRNDFFPFEALKKHWKSQDLRSHDQICKTTIPQRKLRSWTSETGLLCMLFSEHGRHRCTFNHVLPWGVGFWQCLMAFGGHTEFLISPPGGKKIESPKKKNTSIGFYVSGGLSMVFIGSKTNLYNKTKDSCGALREVWWYDFFLCRKKKNTSILGRWKRSFWNSKKRGNSITLW